MFTEQVLLTYANCLVLILVVSKGLERGETKELMLAIKRRLSPFEKSNPSSSSVLPHLQSHSSVSRSVGPASELTTGYCGCRLSNSSIYSIQRMQDGGSIRFLDPWIWGTAPVPCTASGGKVGVIQPPHLHLQLAFGWDRRCPEQAEPHC
ncbi:hypothetical protein V8F20_003141 [Naviculisporaceae sp. PSN 640]